MKKIWLLLIISLFGCNSNQRGEAEKVSQNKAYLPSVIKSDQKKIKQDDYTKQWQDDSVLHQKNVTQIVKLIQNNPGKYRIGDTLHLSSAAEDFVRVSYGNIFSKNVKHLIIEDHLNWMFFLDVLVIKQNKPVKVISHDEGDLTYTGITIKDINGDGKKDFLRGYYPLAGCCRRNCVVAYLYNNDAGFSEGFDFENPTFYPDEKIVRGVEYGHPGEVPLYKYKWTGNSLDTIEYIYPADTLKKKFYSVKKWEYLEIPDKRVTLTSVPAEYTKIKDYDWFINY